MNAWVIQREGGGEIHIHIYNTDGIKVLTRRQVGMEIHVGGRIAYPGYGGCYHLVFVSVFGVSTYISSRVSIHGEYLEQVRHGMGEGCWP